MKIFGERLKELRNERGISQKMLGEIIHVTQQAVFGWEKDLQEPSLETVKALAEFFGISVDYIIGRESEDGIIVITGNELSQDENSLVDNVRQLDDISKETVYRYVEFLLKQKKG